MATSFSGGGSRGTRREPPTMGKQLINFITSCLFTPISFLEKKILLQDEEQQVMHYHLQ